MQSYFPEEIPAAIERLTGKRPDRATVWRWMLKGVRRMGQRVHLAFSYVGGRRIVTHEALIAFLNPPVFTTALQIRTPAQRQRDSERAAKRLEEMGA